MERIKLILIGGTSHVGKSTLGRQLAEEFGWNYLSTDQLARHPGRPWKVGDHDVPDDVVQHYTGLTVAELVNSVLLHYRSNVWPIIDAIVRSRLNNPFDLGLIFEGSAILPDLFGMAGYPRVSGIWLTAPDQLITERIKKNSDYDASTVAERHLIDAFHERTIAIDRILRESAKRNGHEILDASSAEALETLRSLALSSSR